MRVFGFFFVLSFPFIAWAQSLPVSALPGCGDGVMQTGEACDDGNTTSGDGCRQDCQKREVCGDGVQDVGEACDDGNTLSQDGCSSSCFPDEKASFCGDGLLDAFGGEVCDDGNNLDVDSCSADCLRSGVCGNSVLEGNEVCDDGNTQDWDGCPADCQAEDLSLGPKRPGTALILSLGSIISGAAILGVTANYGGNIADFGVLGIPGFFIGPSLGQLYTGKWRHALLFTGLRIASAGVAFAGGKILFRNFAFSFGALHGKAESKIPLRATPRISNRALDALGNILAFVGIGSYATLTIYDIVDAPFSARRANRKFLNDKFRLSLTPAPLSTSSGVVPGLVLGGSF